MRLQPGSPVILNCPENERLHGAPARVVALAPWGCHVECAAAATGRYRAHHSEMMPVAPTNGDGYSGEVCGQCGSLRMRRNGSCLLCDECGATSGCS